MMIDHSPYIQELLREIQELRAELARLKANPIAEEVSDGFGSTWPPCAKHNCSMVIVRPGDARCPKCEEEEFKSIPGLSAALRPSSDEAGDRLTREGRQAREALRGIKLHDGHVFTPHQNACLGQCFMELDRLAPAPPTPEKPVDWMGKIKAVAKDREWRRLIEDAEASGVIQRDYKGWTCMICEGTAQCTAELICHTAACPLRK